MEATDNFDQFYFLNGGGQAGQLIRATDWISCPVGHPRHWSFSLRTNISNLLHANLPTLVLWGSEYTCFYNDAFIASINPERLASIGKPAREILAESWKFIGPIVQRITETGEPVILHNIPVSRYRGGQLEDVIYWTFSYSLALDDNGAPGGVLVTCLEAPRLELASHAIHNTQPEVFMLFEQSPVGIAIIDRQNLTFVMANSYYGCLVGRSPEQMIGKPLLDAIPEIAGQGFEELLQDVITTGKPFISKEISFTIFRNAQQETIYVDLSYQPRREANNYISGVFVVATDVTQQVLARKRIEESEAHLELLRDTVPAMIFYLDAQQRYQSYNETFMNWFGVDRTEAIGKTVVEFIGEAAYQNVLPHLMIAYAGTQERYEMFAPSKMGTARWLNITYTPHKTNDGKVLGLIVHAADITPLKQAEFSLLESEASLKQAIDLAELATWQIDFANGKVTYSERLQDWLGISGAIFNMDASPRIHPKDRERVRLALIKTFENGSSGYFDETYTIVNAITGKERIIHASGQTLFHPDGSPHSIAGTALDVTMQKELQLVLENEVQKRTEELAAINEVLTATNVDLAATNAELTEFSALLVRSNEDLQKFAYVASHDLQEPLRKIQQFGDLLQRESDNLSDRQSDYLRRMQLSATRMSTLITDLLDFSRIATQRNDSEVVSLDEVINDVLSDLELIIEETGAKFHVDSMPQIKGNSPQLGQLFQNLISNALKFRRSDTHGKPVSPEIAIKYTILKAVKLPISVRPTRAAPEYHRIDVIDNGIGFDEQFLDRIFQVFQRLHNKNEYVGNGIGLAISQKVVINHGGTITATSQPGLGSVFSVYFPV